MKKLIAAASLVLAGIALPVGAALADQIVVTAPAGMNEDQMRDWTRLVRQGDRVTERIADGEKKITEERAELARAQARLIEAQAKVQEEERELTRAENRLKERLAERSDIEARMVVMGGTYPALVLNTAN